MALRSRCVLLLLVLSAPAVAGATAPCGNAPTGHARWFDHAQGYFSERACVPAVWFDRFFGDEREDDVASAFVRVIPSAQYSQRDGFEYGVRFKARVSLPNLRDRFSRESLSLVVDDTDEDDSLLPGEADRPGGTPGLREGTSAALRYLVRLGDGSRFDIDLGLRSLKFFARARYVTSWQHSPILQTRYTQSFQFLDGDGFGETSLIEVERILRSDTLLRWSTQATVSEVANGLALREGVQVRHQLDPDRAISWGIATTINSDPAWKANSYSASVRYRQRMFRPWFFVEAEPYLDWIRADRFNTNPGIALRVEFWFGDTGRRRGDTAPEGEGATEPAAPLPEAPAPAGEPVPEAAESPVAAPEDGAAAPLLTDPTSAAPADAPAASQ